VTRKDDGMGNCGDKQVIGTRLGRMLAFITLVSCADVQGFSFSPIFELVSLLIN
jgi:hypothetical protein